MKLHTSDVHFNNLYLVVMSDVLILDPYIFGYIKGTSCGTFFFNLRLDKERFLVPWIDTV